MEQVWIGKGENFCDCPMSSCTSAFWGKVGEWRLNITDSAPEIWSFPEKDRPIFCTIELEGSPKDGFKTTETDLTAVGSRHFLLMALHNLPAWGDPGSKSFRSWARLRLKQWNWWKKMSRNKTWRIETLHRTPMNFLEWCSLGQVSCFERHVLHRKQPMFPHINWLFLWNSSVTRPGC